MEGWVPVANADASAVPPLSSHDEAKATSERAMSHDVAVAATEDASKGSARSPASVLHEDQDVKQHQLLFGHLCVVFEAKADVLHSRSKPCTSTNVSPSARTRRLYAKVSVDPGNQYGVSKAFVIERDIMTWRDEIRLSTPSPAACMLPFEVELLVEIYEIHSEVEHELLGSGRISARSVMQKEGKDMDAAAIRLSRRLGRGFAGTMVLRVNFQEITSILPLQQLLRQKPAMNTRQGRLVVVALGCIGLEETLQPVMRVSINGQDGDMQSSDVAVWREHSLSPVAAASSIAVPVWQPAILVWNHQFSFDLDVSCAESHVISFTITDTSSSSNLDLARNQLRITEWESLASFDSFDNKLLPMHPAASAHGTGDFNSPDGEIQLLLACCWLPAHERERTEGNDSSFEETALVREVQRSDGVPQSILLGSTIEIAIRGICRVPQALLDAIMSKLDSSHTSQPGNRKDLVLKGRLLPGGSTSQIAIPIEASQIDTKHCEDSMCVQFTPDNDDKHAPCLRFGLAPTVLSALQSHTDALRVYVDVQVKRSRGWSLSCCIGLTSFIREFAPTSCGWRSSFKLRNQEDTEMGGRIRVSVLCREPQASDQVRNHPVQKIRSIETPHDSAIVKLEIQGLKPSNTVVSSYTQLLVKIWSSSYGRRHTFTSSILGWDGAATAASGSSGVSQKASTQIHVPSVFSEVFFIEVYRYSHRERNERIGSCSFSLPTTEKKQTLSAVEWMSLVAQEVGDDAEICAEIRMSVRVEPLDASMMALEATQMLPQRIPTAASTILSDVVCYSASANRAESSHGRLEIDLVEAYPLRSLGGSLCIRFRMPSAQWSTRSRFQDSVTRQRGGRNSNEAVVVPWNETFATDVSWSPNERLVPTLYLELFLQPKAPSKRNAYLICAPVPKSSPSARSVNSNLKRARAVAGTASFQSREGDSNNTPDEQRIGSDAMDLCALFVQPSGWVWLLLLIPLDTNLSTSSASDVEIDTCDDDTKLPVLMKLRLVPPIEAESVSVNQKLERVQRPYRVDGDVCVHVRTVRGSFLSRNGGRKGVHAARYVISIGFGEKCVSTRPQGPVDGVLDWNEHIVLRVNCAAPPLLQLALLRVVGNREDSHAGEDVANAATSLIDKQSYQCERIGHVSLPLFPSIIQDMHLVPFSLPIVSSLQDQQGKQLETRKCGSINFEIQVLDRDPASSVLPTNEDIVKLSLHQLQGLYGNSTLLDTLSSTAHLRVLLLRSGSHSDGSSSDRKDQLQRETLLHDVAVHLRPGAESSEVNETIDISQAIGSLGDQKQGAVLAVQVCDVARNPLGQTHIRIGKDWKTRLPQKQKAWYPLYASESNEAIARIQLSFSLISKQEANKSAEKVTNIIGKLYVEVKEAVLLAHGKQLIEQAPSDSTTANIHVWITSKLSSAPLKRGRTRKTHFDADSHRWVWRNEWITIDRTVDDADDDTLCFELVSNHLGCSLIGELAITAFRHSLNPEPRVIETNDDWISLTTSREANANKSSALPLIAEAQLLVRTTYAPALVSDMELSFGPTRSLSGSLVRGSIAMEKHFIKCMWQTRSYTTEILGLDTNEIESSMPKTTLVMPLDLRVENSASQAMPLLRVQWMGFSEAIPAFCVGELEMDLPALWSTGIKTVTSASTSKWYAVYDPHDSTRQTGFVNMRVTFRLSRQAAQRNTSVVMPLSHHRATAETKELSVNKWTQIERRTAAAESLVVWKKLFYLLDEDGNGRIDRTEFKHVFLHHAEALAASPDGQSLFRLLFGTVAPMSPSEMQMDTLFAEMDTNDDNKIEWSEYLRFLCRKQQERGGDIAHDETDHLDDEDSNEEEARLATLPISTMVHKNELRTKKREDVNAAPLMRAPSFQDTVNARQSRQQSKSIPPPFPPTTASSRATRETPVTPRKGSVKLVPDIDKLPISPGSASHVEIWRRPSWAHGGAIASPSSTGGLVRTDQIDALKSQLQQVEDRLDAKDEECTHVRRELASAHAILSLEQQKYASLNAEYQFLQRQYQGLQLTRQKIAIQEEAKAVHVKQTIAHHEQLLKDRDALRRNHHVASIRLQSKIRSRLEQKRFHALKLTRTNAAITLQCFVRCQKAKQTFRTLQSADALTKKRHRAAMKLQQFARYHLHRKARAMMLQALHLSAQIIQKYVRRLLGVRAWKRKKASILKLQCWARQRLVRSMYARLRDATHAITRAVHSWMCKWKWKRLRTGVRRIQRWWRHVARRLAVSAQQNAAAMFIQQYWWRWRRARRLQEEDAFFERFEAAVCIQAIWRSKIVRTHVVYERIRWSVHLEQTKAAVRIQARWRRRQQQVLPSESNYEPEIQGNATGAVFAEESEIPVNGDASSDLLDGPLSSGDNRLEGAANNQEFGDACLPLSTEETQDGKEKQVSDDADAVDDVGNGKSEGDENEVVEEGEGNSSDVQCGADGTATIGEANAESMHECGAQAAKKLPKPANDLPENFEPMTGKDGNELMAEQQVVAEIEEVVGSMLDTISVMVSTSFLEVGQIHTPEGSVLVETKTMTSNGSASEMGNKNVIGDAVIVNDGDEVSDLQDEKCRQGKLQDVISCIDDLGLDLDRAENFDRRVSDCPAERIDHELTARCETSMSADVTKSEELLVLVDTSVKQTMETLLDALERTQALEEIATCASPETEELQEIVEGKYCGSDTVGNVRSGIPLDVVTMLDFSPGGINGDSAISDEDEVRDISECADAPANGSIESLNTTEEHTRHSESSTVACRTIDELEGSTGTEALASVSEADRTDKDQALNVVLTDENENELQVSSEHNVEVESEQVLVNDADPVSGDSLVEAHATKRRSPRDHSNASDEREADDPGTEDMLALVNDNDSPSHEVDQVHYLSSDASSLPVSASNRLSATLTSDISALEERTTLEDEDGESDGQRESSVDSNDLMWEVDEIASFGTDVAAVSQSNSSATRSRRSSNNSRWSGLRMDSERILADLTQIEGDKVSKASSHANQETCEALIERTPSVNPSIS